MKKLLIIGTVIILMGTSFFSGCMEEAEAKGTLHLLITDKPSDLEIFYANVTISMIQVHKSGADVQDDEEYENTDELDDDFLAYADGPYEAEVLQDIHFFGDAEGGITPYNWSWDFGDGNVSYEEDPLHNYSSEGLYIVNLTVTDDDGNGAKDWYVTTAKIGDDDGTEDGWLTILEEPQKFDLITLIDVKDELGLKEIPVGKYTQIRLTIEKANITINNDGKIEVHELIIPSKTVKLIKPFWIYEDDTTILTLDFDVHESVHKTGSDKYMLKPTIKIIEE